MSGLVDEELIKHFERQLEESTMEIQVQEPETTSVPVLNDPVRRLDGPKSNNW